MTITLRTTIAAACFMGGVGLVGSALASTPEMARDGHGMKREHGAHHPAKMQAHMTQRLAALKTKLSITADQESAWAAFATAMQPPTDHPAMNREEAKKRHAEMQQLTTPERMARMKALHTSHQAHMDQVVNATTALYAALTPVQRKAFDAWPMHHFASMGPMGHHN